MSRMATSLRASVAGLDRTLCALDAAAHGENISADAPNAHLLDMLGRLAEDP